MSASRKPANLTEGRMKNREDAMAGGVNAFARALAKLVTGENFDRRVLQVAQGPG